MNSTLRRVKPAAQFVGVLACTYAVFQLAVYVWLNSPNVARQRMQRSNDEIVERVRAIYAANDWPGTAPFSVAAATPEQDDAALALVPASDEDVTDCFCPDDAPSPSPVIRIAHFPTRPRARAGITR